MVWFGHVWKGYRFKHQCVSDNYETWLVIVHTTVRGATTGDAVVSSLVSGSVR
jgi:hypothetical protein